MSDTQSKAASAGAGPDGGSSVPPPGAGDRSVLRIACVGASAGGLEAYKEFLSDLPIDTGIAFVFLPHLSPDHDSLMVQLLSRCTALPVAVIEDGIKAAPNHAYVIPANKYVSIRDGILHLTGPIDRMGARTALDWFLVSLADDQRENAICIILSGTDSHGTPGLKVVKANGGLVIAQEPTTAKFSSMPEHAIATGLVDYVLPASRMAEVLSDSSKLRAGSGRSTQRTELNPTMLEQILDLLKEQTRLDFRGYRKNMLARRIQRRVELAHLETFEQYRSYLQSHPDEVARLAKDVMISVTRFFREPTGAFELLEMTVIPEIIQLKKDGDPIRVWVAGCATGEEAYSIAILLFERLEAANKKCPISIFASDVDEAALAFARLGCYHHNIAADISPRRLERFFIRVDEHSFRVHPKLRESITFASHSLVTDPPYSNLDLISCRNVLIYMEPELQEKIIPLLHFALRDRGFLMLGRAESIIHQTDLFDPTSKSGCLYRRAGPGAKDISLPIVLGRPPLHNFTQSYRTGTKDYARPQELMQHLLARLYGPASVLADGNGQILQYHGPTTLFLHLPSGEPSHNVLSLAREGLRNKLRAAIKEAIAERRAIKLQTSIQRDDGYFPIRSTVHYVDSRAYSEPLLLISFEDESTKSLLASVEGQEASLVRQLESELKGTREELEGSIEALRDALEDRKASAEEATSMNEELQSANEELESSREEMHSLNEELLSANDQLQRKVEQLEVLNDDMTNLIDSTDLPTLFVDSELRIQWFTPATQVILNVLPIDVGRPMTDIVPKVADPGLLDDARQVLRSLLPLQITLPRADGQSWMRQIRPYRTKDNRVKGVVITYINVTELRLAEEHLRRLTAVLMDSSDAIIVFDFSGQITAWNRGAQQMYGYTEGEALKMNIAQLVPQGLRREELGLLEVARKGQPVTARETARVCKSGVLREVGVTTTTLIDERGAPVALATTERDLAEGKAVARIQHLATHDQLTGLPNRLLLEELAAHALAQADRSESKVALLFIDVDHFKTINDTRGHQIGDLALELIAKRLKACVRGQDTVVRHGGDEFIVLLTGINTAEAAGSAAEHILSSVSRPYTIQMEEMTSTVSIGISLYPDDASHLERLVRNADTAMYRAKAGGCGTYTYFTPDMAAGVWDRRSLEYGLFRAVEQREFVLCYQPQVELTTGRVIGAEALLRWRHPELGLVTPNNFISTMEETGLIVNLGEWVMLTACQQARSWQNSAFPPIKIGVNLSAVQIGQLDFPATVAKVLVESGLDARYLELEITESALMRNIEPSILRLRQLRQMGVRLAIDDFGTGYSSLSYLRQLPIDRLKMDVSFVHALTADPGANIVVTAILRIAKSLNLQVLAEGVETLEQLNLLQAEGCDEIQGYYFSKPLAPEEFEQMLRDGKTLYG